MDGGKDANGQLHLAAQQFGNGADFYAGPIANNYNSTYYQDNFSAAIWAINRNQINYHIANYTSSSYVMDSEIENWPGNGNTSEGVAAQLAPYVDVNNNQNYDPQNGDYPYIPGDFAVYTIMNDDAGVHTESGGDQLGMEIHSMFYGYDTADDLNNTIFLNVKMYNRSSTDYNDFFFGAWVDPDIGFAANDYVGCDTLRNLAYAYNAEMTDNGQGGQNGYGASTPAVGAVILNHDMHAFAYWNNAAGVQGDPSIASEYYNYMDAMWVNGSHFTYGGTGLGGTVETNYCFSGDPVIQTGWSEVSEANPTSMDKRMMSSIQMNEFFAQSEKCVDLAFVINNDSADHILNVANLFESVDFVQDFYDNNIQPCDQIFLGNDSNDRALLEVKLYPNPASNEVTIQSNSSFEYEILTMNGSLVMKGFSPTQITLLQLDLSSGVYMVKIENEKGTEIQKLIIE